MSTNTLLLLKDYDKVKILHLCITISLTQQETNIEGCVKHIYNTLSYGSSVTSSVTRCMIKD